MSGYEYKNGQRLSKLFLVDGSVVHNSDHSIIEVVLEPGMHCGIPHAVVVSNGVIVNKFCLHNLEGVEFEQPQEQTP